MKKSLLLGLLMVIFASCDEKDSSDKSDFFNRWYNVSTETNDEIVPYEHKPCGKDYIDFNSSGVYRSYTVLECNGNNVADFEKEAGTYSRSAGVVTISIEGEEDRQAKIEILNATELTLSVTGNNGGKTFYNYTNVP